MPENRFYTTETLSGKTTLSLHDEELRHLAVMRASPKDKLEIINGKGELAIARLLSLNKKEARLEISSLLKVEPPSFPLAIAQGIPRPSRLDIILEKGTELGMTELLLFPGQQSEKTSFTEDQQRRIEKVLIAAIKQCGSLWLPKVTLMPPLLEWKDLPYKSYFGDVSKDAPLLLSEWMKNPPEKGVLFIVGPEKGLTGEEEGYLRELGGTGVSLHKNILRTDTAPLCALSLMSHFILTEAL